MSTPFLFAQMDMPDVFWYVLMCVMPIHIWEFITIHGMDIYSPAFVPAAIQFGAFITLFCAAIFVYRRARWPLFIRFGFLPVGYPLITLATNFLGAHV